MFRLSLYALIFIVTAALVTGCGNETSHPKEEAAEAHSSVNLADGAARDIDIKVERIEKRVLTENLHLTGQVHPDVGKETDIEPRFSGKVLKVLVQPGQVVVPGQQLAIVDSHEISSLQAELIEARSQLNIAKASEERERQVYTENLSRPQTLIAARTAAERTRVALQLAEAEFKRLEGLRKEKIAAEKDFLAAQAALEQAKLASKEANSGLQREEGLFKNKGLLRRDLQLAEASTKREQQHVSTLIQRLEFIGMPPDMVAKMLESGKIVVAVPIRSRVNGVITAQDIAVGELVQPGKRVFTITDLSTVAVSVDVPEVDLQWIKKGTPATITVASYPEEKFRGAVSYISDTVNVDTRTVAVRIGLSNNQRKLKVNMFAEIFLKTAPRPSIACPRSAVQEKDGHKIVFVRENGGYTPRKVELASDTEQYYEVVSGLKEGDEVVTQGSLLLKTEITYKQAESRDKEPKKEK